MSEVVYEKTLFENPEKGFQIRLVVNNFRDVEYIHLRKYFLSFDEGYVPSKEGVSMPTSIQTVHALLDGLIEICSKAEELDSLKKHLEQKLSDLTSETE